MRIVGKRRIREFGTRFPKAAEPLKHWANAVQAAAWKNPGALKADFGSADFVGDLTVFNIGGYDKDADVLYVTFECLPAQAYIYVENASGDVLRLDKETRRVVGVTIPFFMRRAAHQKGEFRLSSGYKDLRG